MGEKGTALKRVFVSSVVEGFEEYRDAARRAIEDAGMEPVLVNEGFPSLPISSRNACLDAVDSSDIFVLLLDLRGGWRAPSGKLVVEEELERAQLRKLPILIFEREGARDSDAELLNRRLSDYVDGFFRRTFRDVNELYGAVKTALTTLTPEIASPMALSTKIDEFLNQAWRISDKTCLRVVVAPEREEEVFAPTLLDSDEFVQNLFSLAYLPNVALLSYELPKHRSHTTRSLVIEQNNSGAYYSEDVRLEVFECGVICIDSNVSGRVDRRGGVGYGIGLDVWVLAEEDIEDAATQSFRFVHAVYEYFDKYKRHQRFFFGAALSGIGQRSLERNPTPRNSYGIRLLSIDRVVKASNARLVSRADLNSSQAEIERLVACFRRAIKANSSI